MGWEMESADEGWVRVLTSLVPRLKPRWYGTSGLVKAVARLANTATDERMVPFMLKMVMRVYEWCFEAREQSKISANASEKRRIEIRGRKGERMRASARRGRGREEEKTRELHPPLPNKRAEPDKSRASEAGKSSLLVVKCEASKPSPFATAIHDPSR